MFPGASIYTLVHRPGSVMANLERHPIHTSWLQVLSFGGRRWRYLLWRRWEAGKQVANFIMLNPSTADEFRLDPTCTRARDFAERWGYGALVVTNAFAWRARSRRHEDRSVGRANDAAIPRGAHAALSVRVGQRRHLGRSGGS
jgi:hypothetical protein